MDSSKEITKVISGEKARKKRKKKKVQKIEADLDGSTTGRFSENVHLPEAMDEAEATDDSKLMITLNEVRLNMGFGQPVKDSVVAAPKPMDTVELQPQPWWKFPLQTSAQVERLAQVITERRRGTMEANRNVRFVDISVSDWTLFFHPASEVELINSGWPGITARSRQQWLYMFAAACSLSCMVPMPTSFLQYSFGGGFIDWVINGGPSTNTIWQIIARVIGALLCCCILTTTSSKGVSFIQYWTYSAAIFFHSIVLVVTIMHPCSFPGSTLYLMASHFTVLLNLRWELILVLQVIYAIALVIVMCVPSLQPSDGCPEVIFPPGGGFTGEALTLSPSELVASKYWEMLVVVLCNFPFLYATMRLAKLRYLYALRDCLMWSQYEHIVKTDLVQTENELARAKECLDISNMALQHEQRKNESERRGIQGQTVSLLDIFRETEGYLASVVLHKYLKLLPERHRRKCQATMISWAMCTSEQVMCFHTNSQLVEKVIAVLTEDNCGITLQQILLDIANLY